ncbi:glycosyltransferase family 39 protein [Paracoccus aurantiacus]|uniref:Glycosyltransferase family 39 protein n=1 Tax=Paracoccus aurantiacus TaxID=2599412 RepID=A0A5C6S5U9_9RHOB|nr:glycosyltransferase family 39 protein [Paracoccus aurantiacus]TXB69361.1 glycosyltransferase family 39 protein [Paracoccus aurantiacus]
MRLSIWSVTLLYALTVLTLILLRPLLPIDETRYVAAAWEMHQGGPVFVPHLNGALYGHKPPLLFWLINLVWMVAGVSEFAARLVAPAFAVASVAATGVLAKRLWPDQPWRGGAAALILAVSPLFLLFGSSTMFDAMLGFATLAAMLAIWKAATDPHRRANWLWLGAAIALGVYAKGPVILIHVLPVALLMPLWAGRPQPKPGVWYRGVGLSILVALAFVALWLLPSIILGGEAYRTEVLWRQSAGRMVSSFAHQRPFWFFLALLPLMLWPFGWTLRGLSSLRPAILSASPQTRMLVVWFLGALIIFSAISGKQLHYIIPELPALALLISGGLPARQWRARDLWLALPVLLVLLVVLAAMTGNIADLQRMEFRLPVWAGVLGILAFAAGAAAFLKLRSSTIALAALPLALIVGLHFAASPLLFGHYDMRALGKAVAPYDKSGIAVTDGTYHAQLNFAGRLTQPVARLGDPASVERWRHEHPDGLLLDQSTDPLTGMRAIGTLPYRSGHYTLYRPKETAE